MIQFPNPATEGILDVFFPRVLSFRLLVSESWERAKLLDSLIKKKHPMCHWQVIFVSHWWFTYVLLPYFTKTKKYKGTKDVCHWMLNCLFSVCPNGASCISDRNALHTHSVGLFLVLFRIYGGNVIQGLTPWTCWVSVNCYPFCMPPNLCLSLYYNPYHNVNVTKFVP